MNQRIAVEDRPAMTRKAGRLAENVLRANQHDTYWTEIDLENGVRLRDFLVMRHVLRPEVVSSVLLAKHLAGNRELFTGRTAIDMGSGSGIQGVVMALKGAKRIICSDISPHAVINTRHNAENFGVQDVTVVIEGDLFSRIEGAGDLVVFNHPFFPIQPKDPDFIQRAIMDEGELIHRFFEDARYLAPRVVMPFLHAAGETNDPGIQGRRHGYRVAKHHCLRSTLDLNPGDVSIYELECPGG